MIGGYIGGWRAMQYVWQTLAALERGEPVDPARIEQARKCVENVAAEEWSGDELALAQPIE